jgi:MFS family permease
VERRRFGSLRAFRHADYSKIWAGAFLSNVGTWMENIAVGVYVTETTHQAGWTGTIAALMFLPAVVLAPIGGALADRFDRRRYLFLGTLAQGVLAALLAVLAYLHLLSLPAIAVLMFLTGSASTLVSPGFSALLAELVPPEDLLSAISLSSAQYNLGRVVGPTLAAGVIAAGGFQTAFTFNACSFIAVLAAIYWMRPQAKVVGRRTLQLWSEIRAGIDVCRKDATIQLALAVTLATAVLIAPFIGLVPAFAIKVFHGGAATTSLLVASQGVGAVCAALVTGGIAEAIGRGRMWGGSVALAAPLAALYWISPTLHMAVPAILVLGGVYLAMITGANTLCLSRVPTRVQARMSSIFSLVLGGGYSVGLVLMGWTGDRIGLHWVGVGSAALFAALVLALRWRAPHAFDGIDEEGHALREDTTMTIPTMGGPAKVKPPR